MCPSLTRKITPLLTVLALNATVLTSRASAEDSAPLKPSSQELKLEDVTLATTSRNDTIYNLSESRVARNPDKDSTYRGAGVLWSAAGFQIVAFYSAPSTDQACAPPRGYGLSNIIVGQSPEADRAIKDLYALAEKLKFKPDSVYEMLPVRDPLCLSLVRQKFTFG